MKLKINESKLGREIKLRKTEADSSSLLMELNSNHIINTLEENMKLRETPILERLKKKLQK